MGILQSIAKVLSYPKSVALGFTAAAPDMMGGARYSYGGRTTTGDTDLIKQGLKGNLSAMDITERLVPGASSTKKGRAYNTLMDIVYDPLWLTGPIGKSATASPKLAKLAPLVEGMNTFGKIEKGADAAKYSTLLPKAGQALRRLNTGTQATGDILSGIGAASLLGVSENTAAKLLPKLLTLSSKAQRSLAQQAAEDIVGQGAEKALSKTGLDKLSEVVETRPNSTIAKQLMMALKDDGTQLSFPGMGQPGKAVAAVDPAIAQQLGFPGLEANKQLSLPGFSRVNPPAIPPKTKAPRVNPPVAPKPPRVNPPVKPALQAFKDLKLPKELTETAGGPIIMGPGNEPIPVATLIKAIKNLDSGTYRSANPSKVVAKAAPALVEKTAPVAKKPVAKKPVAKKAAEKPKPKSRMVVTRPKAKITDAEALALLQGLIEKG